MAWFQNLAGRAEDLLIKFDQNAANVLSESNFKLLENTESTNASEPEIENDNSVLLNSNSETTINVETKERSFENNLTNSNSSPEHYDANTYSDNVSVVSERSRISDNDDSGIIINIARSESYSKKDCSSPKSQSLQTSFILMDDAISKYEEKIVKLEKENDDLNKQLIHMCHVHSEIRNENTNLENQLERTNQFLIVTQQEMEQYRARAQRILQEKEKLIMLKETHTVLNDSSDNILLTYNEELRKELQFQEEKNRQLLEKLSKTNDELSMLQNNFVLTQNDGEKFKQNLQNLLDNERKNRTAIEEEYSAKHKELKNVLQQLEHKSNVITTKSKEISYLKEQLKQKSNIVVANDLESRIHALTQTLMTKQNILESVTTERNALKLQLEKLENEHYKVILQLQNNLIKNVVLNENDETKVDVPHFMKISPFDVGVTRKVKRAYSSLDAVSVRTGVFLRRYPMARVFVFCYVVLLHILVFLILCTYVP